MTPDPLPTGNDAGPESLLNRLRRGGTRADWDWFVRLYQPLLAYWVRQYTRRADLVDDIVQDTIVRVMEKIGSFRATAERSFLGWLRTIVRNRWRELCRKAAAAPGMEDPAVLATVASPDDRADRIGPEDRMLLVRRALQIMQRDFQPNTWQACWERVVNDRPAADVAAELGVTELAVYAACWRVIRRLQAELAGAWS
jgi:RNA polymerase sigma-70 factor (ECF subfamily)